MEIRQDIQFLRGIAVLLVVLFHLQIPFFNNGLLGVDIFFVISGFLMAKLYNKGTLLDFYTRRLNRLVPVYFFTLLAILIIGALLTIPVDFNQIVDQVISGLFFVSNIFFWNQNSYFENTTFNPLLNLWSLAVEVQFYLFIPLIYPILRNRKYLFITIFLISLISCLTMQAIVARYAFFLMPFRVWEFLIGAGVGWWGHSSPKEGSKFLISGLIASVFAFTIMPDATDTQINGHPAFPALVVTVLTGLVINFGIDFHILKSWIGKLIIKIGDASYSIYLVHFPIIVLFNYSSFGGTTLSWNTPLDLISIALLIGITSLISYVFIEKKLASKLHSNKAKLYLAAVILISAFALKIGNIYPYSVAERNILHAVYDRDTVRCGKLFRKLNPGKISCSLCEGDKNIMLIGNSHADSIKKVFSEKGKEYGLSTYFIISNSPLMSQGPGADTIIKEAIDRHVEIIVLHFNNIYGETKVQTEITKLINLAKQNNIKVVLIGPIPTYQVHIPKVMLEGTEKKSDFKKTKETHLKETKQFRDFIESLPNNSIDVVDPSDYFYGSDGYYTYSTSDSKPYYFDSTHLTLTGASRLTPLFDKIFKK